jgi:catechol 2,3-dioxygenase-like lactoylglutathione lyase family enzyme
VTLATRDMRASIAFYTALGFEIAHCGPDARLTSFHAGGSFLNIIAKPGDFGWWGRAIFYVSDVDAMHAQALAAGFRPDFEPRDAPWGERYFHLFDPDGHELSFARPINQKNQK